MALSMVQLVFAPVTLPLIYVDPEENVWNPGDTFVVNVNIQDAVDLFSYEAKLGCDLNILNVVSVDEGPFIQDGTTSPSGTYFTSIVQADFIYVACVTLGPYPGVSGTGTLFSVTFSVIDAGACDLPVFDSILLDSTGAMIAHEAQAGSFATAASGNLVRRSAWPEHHHFVVSKDEDANQTLTAKAKNLGPIDLYIMIAFDIMRDDALVTTIYTAETLVTPDTIIELSADFGPLTAGDAGKYYVSARAWYSWTGTYWSAGDKVKTFSFAVVA